MKTLSLLLSLSAASLVHAAPAPFVWVEGESAENPPDFASVQDWESPEQLSGRVLAINFDNRSIEKMPEEPTVLTYRFEAPEAGTYDLWGRFVFSGIRASFEWRVNGGQWQGNSQDEQPVTNIQELSFWNPVGWSPMGEVPLEAGANNLEIRLDKAYHGEDAFRFIVDAFAFQQDGFRPNFKYAPDDEAWRDDLAEAAEAQIFQLEAEGASEPRTRLELTGPWQYAPFDERIALEETRRDPAAAYPDLSNVRWYGLNVPGDRNAAYDNHRYVHRYLLRTNVHVPQDYSDHRFLLHFEALSLINTLFVNGRKVDSFDIHYGQWQVDIGDYLEPGANNEILMVVKDGWYALDSSKEGSLTHYYPWSLWERNQGVTMRLEWPIKGADKTGILDTVSLVAMPGPAYIEDVFVKPFPITREQIEVDVTIRNPGSGTREVAYALALEPGGNEQAGSAAIPGGEARTVTVTFPSDAVPMWWPDEPELSHVHARLSVDGEDADRLATRFGNREWEVRGNQFYLNGIRQHLRANLAYYGTRHGVSLEEVREGWREMGQNMFRRRFQWPWFGMSPRQTLAWADEVGIPVRQNAGTFDGQHASYGMTRQVDGEKLPREILFENWRAQILNGVKARRNHPSVMIWELDNEIVYINGRNFGNLDIVEPEFTKTSNAVMEMDPTRVTVVGGGNAGLQMQWPTYGVHYFEVADREYPDAAYTLEPSLERAGSERGGKVWPIDFDTKPIFMSETAFLPGRNAAQFAAVVGEKAFLGKMRNKDAFALLHEMYGTGYRWKETGAVHFWVGLDAIPDDHDFHYWQPVAPLLREWDRSFGPGEKITRTVKLFNDTRNDAPITVSRSLGSGERTFSRGEDTHRVQPGGDKRYRFSFTAPEVSEPVDATLTITAEQEGETVYTHGYAYRVLPASSIDPESARRDIAVWDPSGTVQKRLRAQDVTFSEVNALADIEGAYELLIVGPNAITADLATDPLWMRLAASGKRLLVLEQEHPLHYQAIPADAAPAGHDGRMSFSQNIAHPVFAGLTQHDLSFWDSDHVVYRNIYTKPSRGASSLAHADNELGYSTLLFVPVDESAMLLTQYAIGEKLDSNIVAQTLFDNMVDYMAGYEQTIRPTSLAADSGGDLDALFSGIALDYERGDDPLSLLEGETQLLVVDGTPDKLAALAENKDSVQAYFERGGWLVVMGVTPDSLEPFNELVGYDHLIRPFEMERVTFPPIRDPLTAGLTLRDVVMGSGKRINNFNRDEWPADDAFGYILDLKDVAPFAELPGPAHFNDPGTKGPGSDTWPRNMVNGFTAADSWRLGFSIHLDKGDPTQWNVELPRREQVNGITIQPNRIYHPITQVRLTFDGREEDAVTLDLADADGPQSFTFEPRPAKTIHFNITEWIERGRADVIGIDDLEILAERPEGFDERVRPMLNIGGLIKYPRAQGGIVVNQYRIAGTESNPVNKEKKKTVTATILRNLGAPFSGARAVIAGRNLRYEPVSLEAYGNLYLQADQGFPNRRYDLSALPLGERVFADVKYDIRDFSTSPLESGVTLQHPRFKSNAQSEKVEIAVDKKADALFFLHTAMISGRWNQRRNPEPPTVFQYRVTYADGEEAIVPVELEQGVADYLKENPSALPEAAVAWQAGVEDKRTAVYQMQWNNPNPDKAIASVTLEYGTDGAKWGLPILLGVTVAQSQG